MNAPQSEVHGNPSADAQPQLHEVLPDAAQTQELLRKSEMHYRMVSELTTTFAFDLSIERDGRIVLDFLSDNFYSFAGRDAKNPVTFESLLDHIHSDDRVRVLDSLRRLLAEPQSAELECRALVGDTHECIWIMLSGKSHRDEAQGKVTSVAGAVTDISKRKQAEEALRESEARYRELFDGAIEGIYRTTLEGKVLACNPALARMLGFESPEKLIGDVVDAGSQLWAIPGERKKFVQLVQERGIVHGYECRFVRTDGKIIWVSISSTLVREKKGHGLYLQGFLEDITERRRAEDALAQSENQYRSLVELSHDMIGIIKRGTLVYMNGAGAGLLGASSLEQVVGRSVHDFFPYGYRETAEQGVEALLGNGKSPVSVKKLRRLDGSLLDVEIMTEPFTHQGENAVQLVARNISERKSAEDVLKESEKRFRGIFQHSASGMVLVSPDFRFLQANQAFCAMLGYEESELLTMTFQDVTFPEDRPIGGEMAARVLAGEIDHFHVEKRYVHKNGSVVWGIVSATLFRNDHGEPRHFVAQVEDITERKRVEEALRESEYRLTRAEKTAKIGNWKMLLTTREMVASPGACEIYGIDKPQMSLAFAQAVPLPAYRESLDSALANLVQKDIPYSLEFKIRRPRDGEIVDIYSVAEYDRHNNIVYGVIQDITERKANERAVAESEKKFRSIIEQSADGIVVTDETGAIVEWNAAQEEITGRRREEVHGLPAWEAEALCLPPGPETAERVTQIRQKVLGLLRGDKEWKTNETLEHPIVLPNGGTKLVSEHVFSIKTGSQRMLVSIVNDITERKKAENDKMMVEQYLQQAQRLESLGVLAGGIAHDFNNILMGVFGFADLAKQESRDPLISGYLSEVMQSLERAKALTQQLLTFSKGGAPQKRIVPIGPIVEETCQFALHGSNIKCDYDFQADLWQSNIDAHQIGQVIQNLVINAVQAMPLGGTIRVAARNVSLRAKEHPLLQEGKFILISITDQGIGIAAEMLPHVFDPFFTTKPKGHGLGLAISYSIISRHGGAIDVASELGKGTVFTICLPASEGSRDAKSEPERPTHRGTGRILVMDDEEPVRRLIAKMLASFGYSVAVAENGREAIDFFIRETRENGKFAAMILDLTIPGGMGGKEVAQEIRRTNSEIPLFVSSGYASDPIMARPQEYGFTAGISKPFRMAELMELLERHVSTAV